MKYTRLSLLYPIVVLLVSGLILLIQPSLVFSILKSNTTYRPEIANLLGMMFIGLGIIILLIFWHKAQNIYKWTIPVRIFFCICSIGFYFLYQNPFFIMLLFIILIGIFITILGVVKDQRLKNTNT